MFAAWWFVGERGFARCWGLWQQLKSGWGCGVVFLADDLGWWHDTGLVFACAEVLWWAQEVGAGFGKGEIGSLQERAGFLIPLLITCVVDRHLHCCFQAAPAIAVFLLRARSGFDTQQRIAVPILVFGSGVCLFCSYWCRQGGSRCSAPATSQWFSASTVAPQ